MRKKVRIGIIGISGSGKTSLALRLAPNINVGMAYVSGDFLLEENIVRVVNCIDKVVVEHIDLAKLILEHNLDLHSLIFLNLPVNVCIERVKIRSGHWCNPIENFHRIHNTIHSEFKIIQKNSSILCKELNMENLEWIINKDLYGAELLDYIYGHNNIISKLYDS